MKKTKKNKIEEFIRVDHAGERGAIKIYEGQLLALNTVIKDEELKKKIEEMIIHEKDHHDHLIDIENGTIIEFQNEEIEMLQKKIAEELGFELVDHRLELYARKKQ